METISFNPIGVIKSPFPVAAGMPIQAVAAKGIEGSIELCPEYREGLKDLEGFSHLILIYHLHLIQSFSLTVTPFLDTVEHGVFATRSPGRPNALGLSIVRLQRIEDCTLYIEDVDIVDGTPLLDIKPYIPQFDDRQTDRIGWFGEKAGNVYTTRADNRFQGCYKETP